MNAVGTSSMPRPSELSAADTCSHKRVSAHVASCRAREQEAVLFFVCCGYNELLAGTLAHSGLYSGSL